MKLAALLDNPCTEDLVRQTTHGNAIVMRFQNSYSVSLASGADYTNGFAAFSPSFMGTTGNSGAGSITQFSTVIYSDGT